MLKKILMSMGDNNTRSIRDIASELNITMTLTSLIMNDLDRLGYLEKMESGTKCLGCPGCKGSSGCSPTSGAIWVLTGKGEKYVQTK